MVCLNIPQRQEKCRWGRCAKRCLKSKTADRRLSAGRLTRRSDDHGSEHGLSCAFVLFDEVSQGVICLCMIGTEGEGRRGVVLPFDADWERVSGMRDGREIYGSTAVSGQRGTKRRVVRSCERVRCSKARRLIPCSLLFVCLFVCLFVD